VREQTETTSHQNAKRSNRDSDPSRSFTPIDKEAELAQTKRRLQYFMIARVVVASLLLGAALYIAVDERVGFRSFTPSVLIALFVLMYASTLAFALALTWSRRTDRVIFVQVVFDLLVTTVLVFLMGGLNSGFTFLYGVAVLMAAMVMGPVQASVTGAWASLLYLGIGICLAKGWLPYPPDQSDKVYALDTPELVSASITNLFGLLLVTILASGLASRLRITGGELKIAKASAAQLARLNNDIVRSLGSGLLTTDFNGAIQTIYPTGIDMFRCTEEALIGRRIDSILVGVEPGVKMVSRAESTATRPDDSTFPVGFSINALQNEEGDDIGTVIVFQDLTEITQLRDAANRADRLATLGRLSAGLAHEIRNPLNSISGSVELVRDSPRLDQQERRLLSVILKESDRLNELVTNMLQVGRPVEPQLQNQVLGQLVEEVVEMARQNPSTNREVNVETSLPQDPVTAYIDGDQIKQVLWNLIKNAIQASPSGATVRVRLERESDGQAVIEVSDDGMGIDSENTEKIFEMFHSERTQGAGIGLALVRQIVDAHKGSIVVKSSPNKGATFRVALPVRSLDSVYP
jgi:two-component system sensor histidine kinase PilS (NtrC family)